MIFHHSRNAGLQKEFPEHFRKLLLGIVIGPDIEDQSMIGSIVQQTLVAFIRLQDAGTGTGSEIPSESIADKMLGKSAGNERRSGAESVKRFREPCGNRGLPSGEDESRKTELSRNRDYPFR